MNPRTNRPVGYAFVDLKKAEDAQKAIDGLSGKDILERKVSVQLARKPEPEGVKAAAGTGETGETAQRKRSTGRGRGGRGRGRGGRTLSGRETKPEPTEIAEKVPDNADVLPLQDKTNKANETAAAADKNRAPRPPKQRGPPEDGIPSTTKVMVANLPYDLTEEKVR